MCSGTNLQYAATKNEILKSTFKPGNKFSRNQISQIFSDLKRVVLALALGNLLALPLLVEVGKNQAI